jgi:hypothetical protein
LNQLCRTNTANKVSAAGRVEQIGKSQPKICWTFGCNESEHRVIVSLSTTLTIQVTAYIRLEQISIKQTPFSLAWSYQLGKQRLRLARFRIYKFSRALSTQGYSVKSPSMHPDPFSEFVHGRRTIIRKRQHDWWSLILLPLPLITDPVSVVILEDARSPSPSFQEDYIR